MEKIAFLEKICFQIHIIQKRAEVANKRGTFGNQFMPELIIMQKNEISFEIHKENTKYTEPYIHIIHSDKIDVILSLESLSKLAGKVDIRTLKQLLNILNAKHEQLNKIYSELGEDESSIRARKVIENI